MEYVYSPTGRIKAIRDTATGDRLHAYASGAGDLGLVWRRWDAAKQSDVASGRRVTRDEAMQLLDGMRKSDVSWSKWQLHPIDMRFIRKES